MGVEGTFLKRRCKAHLIYKYTRENTKTTIPRELNGVFLGA